MKYKSIKQDYDALPYFLFNKFSFVHHCISPVRISVINQSRRILREPKVNWNIS